MRSSRKLALLPLATALFAMGACTSTRDPSDNQATLATLAKRNVYIAPDLGINASQEQTIAAYRRFLDTAPGASPMAKPRATAPTIAPPSHAIRTT